tara:strand:- start:254 stop:595 length:342 start_codon:yes stop_codon:yes gene_type:complete
MKIYHNPRCSKSRDTLKILLSKTNEITVINYLKNPMTFDELKNIIEKLSIQPIELIRKNESVWKENYKSKKLNNNEIIQIMLDKPKLMERPIVTNNKKAVIGRPPENVLSLFN